MFTNTTIAEWLGGAPLSSRIKALTDRSTKTRLQKARHRRQEIVSTPTELCYDNSLMSKIEVIYSLERIKNTNIVGWHYWAQARDSNHQRLAQREFSEMDLSSTQFWAVIKQDMESSYRPNSKRPVFGIELESSFIAGSQKTRAVGDYVLRNQADLGQWGRLDNAYGFDERLPTSRRLEMK